MFDKYTQHTHIHIVLKGLGSLFHVSRHNFTLQTQKRTE